MSGQKSKRKKTIERMKTTKSWSSEQINKIDKLLAWFIKKNRKTIQINKTRNGREGRTNTTENHKILLWAICANKLNNLEETDKFPENTTCQYCVMKKIWIDGLLVKRFNSIMKLPRNRNPGPDGFTGKFCQTFKEDFINSLLLSQKIKEERLLSKSLYQGEVPLPSPRLHYLI